MGLLTIGKFSYDPPIRRGNANTVTIGNYCSIASGVVADSGFNHNVDMISTYPFHRLTSSVISNIEIPKDIYIGHDVYIGENTLIMAGAVIGSGAVIGAHSVITKGTIIYPYEIWAGVPAKYKRMRITGDQVAAMLHINWWDWDDKKVLENAHLLNSENIEEFINLHKIK